MKNTTPSGTRTFSIRKPLGRSVVRISSPIGSGKSAICSRPAAISSIRLRVEPQPIDRGVGQAVAGRGGEVVGVGLDDSFFVVSQAAGPSAGASRS